MAIDLTEKQVDILVNGTQEASYDQRANSADYEVTTNVDNSINYTQQTSGGFNGDPSDSWSTEYNIGWDGAFGDYNESAFYSVTLSTRAVDGSKAGSVRLIWEGTEIARQEGGFTSGSEFTTVTFWVTDDLDSYVDIEVIDTGTNVPEVDVGWGISTDPNISTITLDSGTTVYPTSTLNVTGVNQS